MLLINQTLIRMSRGFRSWIALITLLRFMVLLGITMFATSISTILANLGQSGADLRTEIFRAFMASVILLVGHVLIGEAEYHCTAKARLSLRQRILNKVLELDVSDVDRLGTTNTINSAVDGVETMQIYYNRYLPGLIYGILAPVYLFFALKDKCLAAAILLLACAIVIIPMNNIFRSVIDKLKSDYWRDLGDLTRYFLESLNSLTTTELFNRGEDREEVLTGKAHKLSSTIIGIMRTNFSSVGFNEILMNVAIVASTVIVSVQLLRGKLELASAMTVLMLSYGFFSSIRQLQWIAHDALMGIAAAQNVSAILKIDTEKPIREIPVREEPFDGIELDHVSFAYPGRDTVLRDVDLRVDRGKVTAIVGESGCGKSTIVSMMLRFYDAESGAIRLEGRDYRSLDPAQLRREIIMVPQSVYIFTGTIRENLLIASPGAAEEELLEVLDQVRLLDWVRSQPLGLDAPVGDAGARLSGGQRQKLGIARALLSRAEYIIFDEATSSVDEESEQEIWDCIGRLAEIRTLIIISHRLSTVRNADRIYVIEDGQVKESGTHGELMEHQDLYCRLVREQEELEQRGRRRRRHEA